MKVVFLCLLGLVFLVACNGSSDQKITGILDDSPVPGGCYSIYPSGGDAYTLMQGEKYYDGSELKGKTVTVVGEIDNSAKCEAIICECTSKIHINKISSILLK